MPGFAPPDYLMVETQVGGRGPTQIIRQHGGWKRIETEDVKSRGRWYETTDGRASISVIWGADGRPTMLLGSLKSRFDAQILAARHTTGETRVVAGERCRVWRSEYRYRFNPDPIRESGCTTADGITLWRGYEHGSEWIATRLERRHVAPADVAPPIQWLDPTSWMDRPDATAVNPGFQVILRPIAERSGKGRWIVERSGPWTSTRTRDEARAMRHDTLTDESRRFAFTYTSDRGGQSVSLQRRSSDQPPFSPAAEHASHLADQRVLGEGCSWWVPNRDMEDVVYECRTADGAPLKTRNEWDGDGYIAMDFRRGPVPLARLLPRTIVFPRAR